MRALALIVILSACSVVSGGAPASLDGEWRLTAGTNQGQPIPIVAGSKVTLTIDGSQVGGTAACNSFGGKIEIHGSSIVLSELFQTEMACLDDRLMASEAAYMAALSLVTTAARTGDTLVLTGPQVELRFASVPPVANANLVGTVWVLDSVISGEAVSSTVGGRATMQLNADGTFATSTGCREITGRYTISGNQLQATIDPYDTIACANPVGEQDVHVLKVLSNGFSATIDGNSLTLSAGDLGLGYQAAD
jgi:heat shock protein HslJ